MKLAYLAATYFTLFYRSVHVLYTRIYLSVSQHDMIH